MLLPRHTLRPAPLRLLRPLVHPRQPSALLRRPRSKPQNPTRLTPSNRPNPTPRNRHGHPRLLAQALETI